MAFLALFLGGLECVPQEERDIPIWTMGPSCIFGADGVIKMFVKKEASGFL